MIIDGRQAKFGAAEVPPIAYSHKIDVSGYEKVQEVFSEAFMVRFCYEYGEGVSKADQKMYKALYEANKTAIARDRFMFTDCVNQTVTFLKRIGALKPMNEYTFRIIVDKRTKKRTLELWKEGIKMPPFYEGVNCSLGSMMIEKYCPDMARAMANGAVYSHQTLTNIKECVLYVMEYFQKEGLLVDPKKVLTHKETIKWIEDHIKYCKEHKEELEEAQRRFKKGREKEMRSFKRIEKKLDKLAESSNDGPTLDELIKKGKARLV